MAGSSERKKEEGALGKIQLSHFGTGYTCLLSLVWEKIERGGRGLVLAGSNGPEGVRNLVEV